MSTSPKITEVPMTEYKDLDMVRYNQHLDAVFKFMKGTSEQPSQEDYDFAKSCYVKDPDFCRFYVKAYKAKFW